MTYYRLVDNKPEKLLFGAVLFLMLILSRSSMYVFAILPFTASQLMVYGILGVMGIWFLIVNRDKWKQLLLDRRWGIALIATLVLMIPVLIKRDLQTMNFTILLCVYIAIFFSFFISCRTLAYFYVGFMTFLAAYSLIACYLLEPLVEQGLFTVPVINYQDWRIFHNFVFAFPRIKEGYLRNFGMFREPGLYQYFLNLAIFCNNFLLCWRKQWIKWTINAVLAITVISTFSTAGFAVLAVLAVSVFFHERLYRNRMIVVSLSAALIAAVAAVLVSAVKEGPLFRAVYEMLEKFFVINRSSSARYEAIYANLKVFFKNPFVGERIATVLELVDNNTSSSTLLYAAYGFFGGTLNVLGWLALAWDKNRSIWLNVLLFVALLMSFNTQNFTTDVFFWLFPIMALTERTVPLLEQKIYKKKA